MSVSDKIKFIEKVFGTGRLSAHADNIGVHCPVCDSSDRSKRKLSIKLDSDVVHCWTCGFSSCNLLPLIIKIGDREAAEYYKHFYLPEAQKKKIVEEVTLTPQLPIDYRLLSLNANSSDPDVGSVINYASARNLSMKDMSYYMLGCSTEKHLKRRLILPSFDTAGCLNYVVTRAIDDTTYPRYVNSLNSKTSIIFNELRIDWNKKLLLVEGPFDMMKCPQNTACMLGSELNEKHKLFSKILENKTDVILCLDEDAKNKAIKIALLLVSYDINVSMINLPVGKDPGSLSKNEMLDFASSARPWSREFSLADRIRNIPQKALRI